MIAFAANSLLCRLALSRTAIDAASFTAIRLVAGALMLWLLSRRAGDAGRTAGDWTSALALSAYAACFSWAYIGLPAATGALLLFGAVQLTMIGWGFVRGERLAAPQALGLLAAFAGLLALLLPGAHAPQWGRAALMLAAGVAWGVYSLRGRGAGDPLAVNAGNFRRGAVLALAILPLFWSGVALDTAGVLYAVASGALASGIGYSIWYAAVRGLSATGAASVQLSVPAIAALGAVVILGEPLTLRLVLASIVILGGIALVIGGRGNR
jgi:drug/metabolite transporter (DMT)-like permease